MVLDKAVGRTHSLGLSSWMAFAASVSPTLRQGFYDRLKDFLNQCDFNMEVMDEKKDRKNLKEITGNYYKSVKNKNRLSISTEPERILKTYNVLTGLSGNNALFISRKFPKKQFNIALSNFSKVSSSQNVIHRNQEQNLTVASNIINGTEFSLVMTWIKTVISSSIQ